MHATERIEIIRPSALPGVEVLYASACSRAWQLYHERYVFVSGSAGASEWRYRGRDYLQERRGVMLIEPGELHRDTRVLQPTSFEVLFVEPAILAAAAADLGAARVPHPSVAQTSDPALWDLLTGLHGAIRHGAPILEQQSRLADGLRLVLATQVERPANRVAPADRPAAERARAYLHAHWADDVRLDDLAQAAAQSKYHLARSFREAFGLPPHAYQLQLRIARARALLAQGMPIVQVALATGFSDQSHLTRYFRRAFGVTPGHYLAAQ